MVSNDIAALGPGESCEALLLTPKARVIAPLVVLRRGHDDFLLLTEPDLGERVRAELVRARFAAKAEIELEEHTSHVVFGGEGIPTGDYGEPAAEVLDTALEPTRLVRGARAAPDPRGHAGLGQGDRRPHPPRRGRPDRARGQLHEGLLSRPGADRAAALPRPCESRPARARADELPALGHRARLRGQGGRPDHERRARRRPRRCARLRPSGSPPGRRARPRVVARRCRYTAGWPAAQPATCRERRTYWCRRDRRRGVRVLRQRPARGADRVARGVVPALGRLRGRHRRGRPARDRLLPLARSALGCLVLRQRHPDRASARVDAGEPSARAPCGVAPAWLGPLVRLRRGGGEPDPRCRPRSGHRRHARSESGGSCSGRSRTRSRTSRCGRSWVGRSPAPSAPRASPRQRMRPARFERATSASAGQRSIP